MRSNRFYLACLRDNLGGNVAFHCKDGRGYSTDIDKAHVYTREEAQSAWNHGREFDLPLCADRVDAGAQWRVDCQNIPHENTVSEKRPRYVMFQRGRWEGNDVFWITKSGAPSLNFKEAAVHKKVPLDKDVVWIPFEVADKAKRRTLMTARLDRRKMVQAAGLVTPDHIKRERRRKDSGKTRFNCPECGQIAWQYNPYDFEGCNNIHCEEWAR